MNASLLHSNPIAHRGSNWLSLLALTVICFVLAAPGLAQVVRDNVNIMSPAPGPYVVDVFERQVETDIAVSPLNPGRAMAGFIDYQTLNGPGTSSWCGYSVTNNGGKTWKSDLLPGFPQDISPLGGISPIHDLIQCADPVLAAAPPNDVDPAQFYFGGLGMTKGVLTKVFVATFQDPDDGSGKLKYVRTVQIDVGNYSFQGQVLDKPSIAVDLPSPGFRQGIIHFSYVVFNGTSDTDFRTKVLYARSTDGGQTFSKPIKLNGTFNRNNGTAIARTVSGTTYVFWRTFLEENGIQVVSIDRMGNLSKPITVAGGPAFYAYDQLTHGDPSPAFRSTAFPTAVADVNGRLFVAWQEYVDVNGFPGVRPGVGPRIVLASSTDGGQNWGPRTAVEVGPPGAFQLQPDLSAGGGVVSLLFYDARNDGRGLDAGGVMSGIDRRMEVRVAQAVMTQSGSYGTPLFSPSVEVSKYSTYSDGANTGQVAPRPGFASTTWGGCKANSSHPSWICDSVNLPNLKNTSNGSVPFIGDYIGLVSAVEFKRDSGSWRTALSPTDYEARTFYGVWADNRLVAFPNSPLSPSIDGSWTAYAPGSICANPGSRNTKPYFAVISPGVVARWSGTSRPVLKDLTAATAVNAFTLSVENQTGLDKHFRITIVDNAPTEDWSFVQPRPAGSLLPPLPDSNTADVQVLRHSAFTRAVYYRGTNSTPALPVTLKVEEITGPGGFVIPASGGGLSTSITVPISGSPIVSSSLYGLGVGTQSVKSLPGAKANKTQPHNFGFENFGFENFGFENFGFENFGFENFGFENFGFENSPPADYDVSWTVSGSGLLPTSGDTFVNVQGAQDILNSTTTINGVPLPNYMFRLFVYQTQSTPALNFQAGVSCPAPGQLLQDQLISSIPIAKNTGSKQLVGAFGFENFGFENFGFENYPPDINDAAFVADRDGVKLTLRSYKRTGASGYYPTTSGVVSQGVVPQPLNPGQTTRTGSFDDTTPPVIIRTVLGTAGQEGWYRSDVSVTWSVTDPGSGITFSSGCEPVTLSNETAGTTLTCSATNGMGVSASVPTTIKIDKTPPVITITVPTEGAGYVLNSSVTSNFGCSDALSGVANCTGPARVPTSTLGENTFTVTATDKAGNTSTKTVKYLVIYRFILTPPKSPVTLGSAVPLIWKLTDANGVIISDTGSLLTLTSYAPSGVCGGGAPEVLFSPATGAAGKSDFRFISTTNSFQFNWDTTTALGTGAGCYKIVWQLKDNADPVANSRVTSVVLK